MTVTDQILSIFESRGNESYFGEPVSELEHALQCANLAEREHAADSLVVAALMHDFGHLVHGLGENIADAGVDARHEDVGGAWLARHFGPGITEPVRLHVAAKRYLCAVDPEYLRQLSPASNQSLKLQGGPFNSEEVRSFESQAYFREAVQVRRWDDAAKVPGLDVPGLEHFRPRIEATCLTHEGQ